MRIIKVLGALSILFYSFYSFSASPGCPQIDKSKLDADGMPFCPDVVKTNSAYAVFRCPLEAANSFHAPTDKEKESMGHLLATYKEVSDSGIKPETTKAMLSYADELNLQICRVSQDKQGVKDSFLLVYTKPGIRNYSGPFLMLRETKHSKVLIIGPHDDSDGTVRDTKIALAESSAMAVISNGHKRGNVRRPDLPKGGDFVHEVDNLGTFAVGVLGNLFRGYVWIHVHGMKDPDSVLYRSRSKELSKVYEEAIVKVTNIKPNAFAPLNADFTVDSRVNTNWYVKTEIPARIHDANPRAVAGVVREFEKQKWAWGE